MEAVIRQIEISCEESELESEDTLGEIKFAEDLKDLDWGYLGHVAASYGYDSEYDESGWLRLYLEGGV